ncbi:hypothetical protein LguiB_013223 [Lonicera macranthoides]
MAAVSELVDLCTHSSIKQYQLTLSSFSLIVNKNCITSPSSATIVQYFSVSLDTEKMLNVNISLVGTFTNPSKHSAIEVHGLKMTLSDNAGYEVLATTSFPPFALNKLDHLFVNAPMVGTRLSIRPKHVQMMREEFERDFIFFNLKGKFGLYQHLWTLFHQWDVGILNNLFMAEDCAKVLSTPMSHTGIANRWRWAFTANGSFSVKSSYNLLSEGRTLSMPWFLVFLQNLFGLDHGLEIMHAGACFGFIDWWNYTVQRFKAAAMGEVASIIWGLWQNRNAMVWSGKATPA